MRLLPFEWSAQSQICGLAHKKVRVGDGKGFAFGRRLAGFVLRPAFRRNLAFRGGIHGWYETRHHLGLPDHTTITSCQNDCTGSH